MGISFEDSFRRMVQAIATGRTAQLKLYGEIQNDSSISDDTRERLRRAKDYYDKLQRDGKQLREDRGVEVFERRVEAAHKGVRQTLQPLIMETAESLEATM